VSPPPHSIPFSQPLTVTASPEVLFGNFAESKPKDFSKEEIDDEESGEDYGYSSDSDLEDDEDEKAVSFKNMSKPKVCPFDWSAIPEDRRVLYEEYEERVEVGKIVKIPDLAFVT